MGVTGRAVADTDGWLVVNEDNDHFFKLSDEWQSREGLLRYLDIVLKGPVTHFFMCVNGQRTSYDSKTWEPIWAGLNDLARPDTATAPDGVIEAVECPNHPFFLGVQWHPERYYTRDSSAAALFQAFTKAAGIYQQQK